MKVHVYTYLLFPANVQLELGGVHQEKDRANLLTLLDQYRQYKTSYARNIVFDPTQNNNLSRKTFLKNQCHVFFPARTLEYAPVQLVQIFFNTATYDKIERDKKVTFSNQLSLVGGTMGLLTGFSILSGVEIVYYVIRFFMSLRIPKQSQ